MAGTSKTSAPAILKRIKKLKAQIDKGNVTSIHKAAKECIRSSYFSRALLKREIVHTNDDGFLRWNGLAVTMELAQDVIDDAHKAHRKYFKSVKKIGPATGKRPYKRRIKASAGLASSPDGSMLGDLEKQIDAEHKGSLGDADLIASIGGEEQLARIAKKLKGDIYDEVKDLTKEIRKMFSANLQSIAALSEKIDAVELVSHRMRNDFESMTEGVSEAVNRR